MNTFFFTLYCLIFACILGLIFVIINYLTHNNEK